MNNSILQVLLPSVIFPYFIQEHSNIPATKRGRRIACSTEILSEFLDKKKKKAPRKEYIRCSVLRKMIKLIRSATKSKIKIELHPIVIEILSLITANIEESRIMVEKNSLPFVENHENLEFKSYSDAFCKKFFSRPLAREIYKLYIEYLFIARTEDQRSKDLGIFCCDKTCNDHDCSAKWMKMKELLLKEVEEQKVFAMEKFL
ncbi:hypothetical protein SteCoe_20504 [Stentor coeruleus]|uniref:Uncharacterized protein n=1 Tax=Stentor coeruleus TaxID=5963 RepID=A0A1R2BRV6_9CILI|nr:hypothetical protein SteCoe_20504 [Stentor coeruleus]